MTYKNDKAKEYYQERKQRMLDYLGNKCVSCGEVNNLQIDHIYPETKINTVTKLWSYSWEIIVKELDKCQLLCFSCHVSKTNEDNKEGTKYRKHGTWAMYTREKCRCVDCRKVYNDYRRNWRNNRG